MIVPINRDEKRLLQTAAKEELKRKVNYRHSNVKKKKRKLEYKGRQDVLLCSGCQ